MNKTFLRYPVFTIGEALVFVIIAYAFNVFAFSYIADLNKLISFDDAFFVEGLLFTILGIMILLQLPHAENVGGRRKIFLGAVLTKDDNSHKNTGNILVLGLAFVIAAMAMFLLYFSRVF